MTRSPDSANRTLWIDDNLRVLRGIDSECVDLVYLDPPFNTDRLCNAPLGPRAAGARFDDTRRMDKVEEEWTELREVADSAMHYTIVGTGLARGVDAGISDVHGSETSRITTRIETHRQFVLTLKEQARVHFQL